MAPRSAGVWEGEARGTSTSSTVRPVVSFTSCKAGRQVNNRSKEASAGEASPSAVTAVRET